MTKSRSRLNFLRRARSTLVSLKTKSSYRIISDLSMISPLASDKGMPVIENYVGKKRSLKQSRTYKVKGSGNGNRIVKF